jgi:hypothetical protein
MDERERFEEARQKMRTAFIDLKAKLDKAGVSTSKENDGFFEGNHDIKAVFGDVLLQRDVFKAGARR